MLKVISRSTFDLQAVLDTLVESAARLCEADMASIFRRDGDSYRSLRRTTWLPEFEEFMLSAADSAGSQPLVGRAVAGASVVHIPDVLADPEYHLERSRRARRLPHHARRTALREGMPIGVIVLARAAVRPFTDKQIELVTTFADQAVIAIENVRLFEAEQQRTRELTEALEQQTATSEVLSVISSSPGELEPVFQAMLENAMRICEAKFGTLVLYRGRRLFRVVAMHGAPPAIAELRQREPSFGRRRERRSAVSPQTKQVVHIADMRPEPATPSAIRARRARSRRRANLAGRVRCSRKTS